MPQLTFAPTGRHTAARASTSSTRTGARRTTTAGVLRSPVLALRSSSGVLTLQRTAGNRAVAEVLQRQPDPTPRRPAAGVDLADRAGAVLPGGSGGTGRAVLEAVAALGLTRAALVLLARSGVTDRNALTNIAFWAAHPNLFGTRLDPASPDFATLSAEWVALRDGAVAAALRSPAPAAATPATTATAATTPDAAFVQDRMRSTIERLPEAQRQRFEGITWGWADYPGTEFPVQGMSAEELERFGRDPALTLNAARTKFVGLHQADASALFSALADSRPGGGERRVNIGADAMITREQFAANADQAGIDAYIVGQVATDPVPGGGRLNRHAAAAFLTMRTAALADGVSLLVLSGFRDRASEEAGARVNTNRQAFAGFSPHSLGLAADISLKVGSAAGADFGEASTRMDKLVGGMLGSPAYKWVFLHGADYGFFQYRAEPWHWEYNPPGFRETFWAERPGGAPA